MEDGEKVLLLTGGSNGLLFVSDSGRESCDWYKKTMRLHECLSVVKKADLPHSFRKDLREKWVHSNNKRKNLFLISADW